MLSNKVQGNCSGQTVWSDLVMRRRRRRIETLGSEAEHGVLNHIQFVTMRDGSYSDLMPLPLLLQVNEAIASFADGDSHELRRWNVSLYLSLL